MSKIKVLTRYGRITIKDPALSEELILQVTDGQCCLRPTQEQLDYLKKLAAILRVGLSQGRTPTLLCINSFENKMTLHQHPEHLEHVGTGVSVLHQHHQ